MKNIPAAAALAESGKLPVPAFLARIAGIKTPENSAARVTAEALNIRAGATADSGVVQTLKKGDSLIVTGTEVNGWTPVEHDGARGWVDLWEKQTRKY